MFKLSSWLLFGLLPLLSTHGCGVNPELNQIEHELPHQIIGSWLHSGYTADTWITYEFTESSIVNVETYNQGCQGRGSGFYTIEEKFVRGSFINERDQFYYIDWKVDDVKPFEILMEVYDDDTYLGDAQLYSILFTVEVSVRSFIALDLGNIIGSKQLSGCSILDDSIARVDKTGVVEGVSEGITFITFEDTRGKGAIKIEVNGKTKSISELSVGI